MSKVPALYPEYDGSSQTRSNASGNVIHIDRAPDPKDWDQMVAEMIAVQQHLKTVGAGQSRTIFASNLVTNGGLLQTAAEDIPDLTLTATLAVPGNIHCTVEMLIQPTNTHWCTFSLQFKLDNVTLSPDSLVWYVEAGASNNEKRRVGIHFPFLTVAAGTHTVKVLGFAQNSSQLFNITDRRLTLQY